MAAAAIWWHPDDPPVTRPPRPAPPAPPSPPRISPLGDAAVLVELGTTVDLETNRRVRDLAASVARATAGEPGWGAPVPGACSLLVPVDPLEPGTAVATERLRSLVGSEPADVGQSTAPAPDGGPVLEVPTRYDGPDLAAVAEMTGLAVADVVARHAATEYTTLFLGFVPGFGYLGPLPPELGLPRRPVPRTHVAAGSVAIAGQQTAVYSIASPGGWWLIGRTELVLWDARRHPPALLSPGTRVRFVPLEEPS
jgi:KipI family sensor histidine kinase inhibitor